MVSVHDLSPNNRLYTYIVDLHCLCTSVFDVSTTVFQNLIGRVSNSNRYERVKETNHFQAVLQSRPHVTIDCAL